MTLKKPHLMIKNVKSIFSTEQVSAIFANTLTKQNPSSKLSKTESQYASTLRESRKLRLFYGNLSKKYLQKVFQKSYSSPSRSVETIFSILESRLDVVLYRAAFFESIAAAKQIIHLGGIKVNGKKVVSPGYIVAPGEIVQISQKKQNSDGLQKNISLSVSSLKSSGILLNTTLDVKNGYNLPKHESNNFVNFTCEYLRKLEWRFQAPFFLLSLIKVKKGMKAIAIIDNALHLFKRKKGINSKINEFFVSTIKKENKKDNLDAIAKFTKENKICYLQDNIEHKSNHGHTFGDAMKNRTPFFFLSRATPSVTSLLQIVDKYVPFSSMWTTPSVTPRSGTAHYSRRKTNLPISDGFLKSKIMDNTFFLENKKTKFFQITEKNLEAKSIFLQSNGESRLLKQLSFLNFYQSKIKPRLKVIRSTLLSEKINSLATKIKNENLEKGIALRNNFIFSNYLLHLRKQLLSLQKKKNCFEKQKKKLFFKKQPFFQSKRVKPLHLEISYRSLCIVFLFPPQRITFPHFINLYKSYRFKKI